MNRTKVLLLVVGGLAIAAAVAWQQSFDEAITAPAPAVLTVPASRPRNDVTAAVPANKAAAVTPADNTSNSAPVAVTNAPAAVPKKPATTRAVRRDPPAVASVERTEPAPPSAPAPVAAPAPRELTAGKSNDAETFEALAALSLRQKNYAQARQEFESALQHGGKATFMLLHDHTSGNFDAKDPKATCVGELTILDNEVKFVAPEAPHGFSAGWTDVRDAGPNRFFGSGIGGFHVTITADGKYRNFNLAPGSRDKAEGKLILDLLKDHARKQDRSK